MSPMKYPTDEMSYGIINHKEHKYRRFLKDLLRNSNDLRIYFVVLLNADSGMD